MRAKHSVAKHGYAVAIPCALDTRGAAFCWGDNEFGDLCDGNTNAFGEVPVLVGPQPPASVTAIPGDTTATVSWITPASLEGGTLTGYTATAVPRAPA
jgi:hypothetical protein